MRATVCKILKFDAAHYLPNHRGKCKNMHGHTYEVHVKLHGPVEEADTETKGMVCDFGTIEAAFEKCVASLCDHKVLNEVIPVPTAEGLAAWILLRLLGKIPWLVSVRVYESPTSYAEVSLEDVLENITEEDAVAAGGTGGE